MHTEQGSMMISAKNIVNFRVWAWSESVDSEVLIRSVQQDLVTLSFNDHPDVPEFTVNLSATVHQSPLGFIRLTTPVTEGGVQFPVEVTVGDRLVIQWKGQRKSYEGEVAAISESVFEVQFFNEKWQKTTYKFDVFKCTDDEGNSVKFIYLIIAPKKAKTDSEGVSGETAALPPVDDHLKASFGAIDDSQIPEDRLTVSIMSIRGMVVHHVDFAESMIIPEQPDLDQDATGAERILFQERPGFLRKPIIVTDRRLIFPRIGEVKYTDVSRINWINDTKFVISEKSGREVPVEVRSQPLGTAFMLALQIAAKEAWGNPNSWSPLLAPNQPVWVNAMSPWLSASAILATAYRISKSRLFPNQDIEPKGFAPKPGEQFYWEGFLNLFHPASNHGEWVAGYGGVQVRFAHGISIHLGGAAGNARQPEGLTDTGMGVLYVSNKRIVFVGGNNDFPQLGSDEFIDIPLERISVTSEFAWLIIKTSYRGAHRPLYFHNENGPWRPIEAAHILEYLLAAARG
jgi:hypothetical protein